jgi:tRNA threonylcarbamoyl adenosine modification protein (Sua5/YciO/YrdC/YwlC family)
VVLPTDTVYGLCGDPRSETVARELYRLKQRPPEQPLALLAAGVEELLELVPELLRVPLEALLPGAYTLILPNPARRLPWLTGAAPETIGVRVPELSGPGAEVLAQVGAVVATSANLHRGPETRTLEDVPAEIRAAAVLVDGGELPGTPSTVLDLTGDEPRVLREGAVPTAEALERAADAFGR